MSALRYLLRLLPRFANLRPANRPVSPTQSTPVQVKWRIIANGIISRELLVEVDAQAGASRHCHRCFLPLSRRRSGRGLGSGRSVAANDADWLGYKPPP